MFKDLRHAFRTLLKNPGVTVTAVLTLALGIGANTAVFSVVNAVLLRPLPYRDPARLVTIRAQIPSMNIYGAFVEYNTYGEWWRAQSKCFESMAAFTPGSATLISNNEPERIFTQRVNAGFLSVAGVRPVLGRDFLPEEDQPGAGHVVILSHGLWQRRFGGDRGLIGRAALLDQNAYTVVGILPPEFELYGREVEAYMPLAASTARAPGMPSVGVYARLKSGFSVRSAQAEIDGLCRRWTQQYPYPKDWGARVWTVRDWAVREVRSSIVVLTVAVGLVLLIACANVANLLLARAGARQKEIAIRSALGAGTGRIILQLLTEGAVLALIACALGLLAAWVGVRALATASTAYLPFQKNISVDASVLGFTLATALLTTLLFALAPALAAARANLADSLRDGVRVGEGVRRGRLRTALVVSEVALALLLAIGAMLTARSLVRLQAVNPGFEPDGVLKATITLPVASYGDAAKRVNFFRTLVDRVRELPGVTGAGLVSQLPFSNSKGGTDVVIEGAPPRQTGDQLIAFRRT
ncbi:MAG TPA: ABC transporter permease, partial [Bryobacteraceae bacterium]